MPIDKSLLSDYFTKERRHIFYKESVAMAEAFAPHADGVYPAELIDERRPNEPMAVKDYRAKVWKPKTKPTFGRIVSSLGKIRRSSDWAIVYPLTPFNLITEGETLEDYCERNYPYYESVTNWVFGELLKVQLTDPNTVCIIMPMKRDVPENAFIKPYTYLFNSADVIEYAEDDYVLLNNPIGAIYNSGRERQPTVGKSFYYADEFVIEKWDQVNGKGDIKMMWSYAHGLAEVPFFKLFGVSVKSGETARLNTSRIVDILPELDEAVREYSDLQAGKVGHMHPERWEYTQSECGTCKGLGSIQNPSWTSDCDCPAQIPCTNSNCHGGYVSSSGPYKTTVIRPVNNAVEGGSQLPTPPIGYVQKDIAILELMEKSVRQHIYDGLAAINFQFLEQTPLTQSGVAKEVDKDELNNTVHAIAEDLVRVMDKVYGLISLYRYGTVYPKRTGEMVPSVAVPERFDILSVNYLADELDKAKGSKLNSAILDALEVEYASKKFNADHDVADFLSLVLNLDPLSNVTQDDKIMMLSSRGISQRTYVMSSNIQAFVQRAIEEDDKFAVSSFPDQVKKMETYADELIASMDASLPMTQELFDEETDPNAPIDTEPVETEDAIV